MSKRRPAPPSKAHEDDGRGLEAIAEEQAANRDPYSAALEVADRSSAYKRDDESELELEPTSDDDELDNVHPILEREVDPPAGLRVRWILPPAMGPAHAHAMLVNGGSTRCMCAAHLVEGAIYPPPLDVPKHPACLAALEAARKATNAE